MGDKDEDKDKRIALRIAEINPKFVGRGVALLDDLHLSTGDIIELSEEPLN